MAGGNIFQDHKTESEDKDLCRDISECSYDTDLDSIDSSVSVEAPEVPFDLWLVSKQPCGNAQV